MIPSILLTKGLIDKHIKLTSAEKEYALASLLEKKMLTADKYLPCGKRKMEAYLKFVPESLDSRFDVYSLQRRLLNLHVDVHEYIGSLKIIEFASASLRSSNLLLMKFKEERYSQLNINLTSKRKSMYLITCRHISPFAHNPCLRSRRKTT